MRTASVTKSAFQRLIFFAFLKPVLKPVRKYLMTIVTRPERKNLMKNKLNLLVLSASKINRQHIQLLFVVLSLTMLVLGVGAPEDSIGTSR